MLKKPNQFLKLYLEALRSGKYSQIYNRLRNEQDCFCAMGLALHLASKQPNPQIIDNGVTFQTITSACNMSKFTKLLNELQTLLGLSYGQLVEIVSWNDALKLSFSEIADRIEKHFLEGN